MPKIFICYRREDTPYEAVPIRDRLVEHFGARDVFFDIDAIPLGHDFSAEIDRRVGACDYFIALIGRTWLTATDEDGHRRLDDPNDWVRLEVESALKRNIPVIPLLFHNVRMPKQHQLPEALADLAKRQAHSIRPLGDLHHDVEKLIRAIVRQEDEKSRREDGSEIEQVRPQMRWQPTGATVPYTQEITRARPACFLFLLDQSGSMEEPLDGTDPPKRKCDALVDAINGWLNSMIIKASGSDGVKDWMHVGVIGYRTDAENNPLIGSAFQGMLANQMLVPISKIHQNPLRMMEKTEKVHDHETGETLEFRVQVPVWIDAVFEGGTPMCHGLHRSYEILAQWVESHPDSFPPILVHITDGESFDGDPIPYAEAIRVNLSTDYGDTLVFNCHLSMKPADKILFPSNPDRLPLLAQVLFKMSSVLPGRIFNRAVLEGFKLEPNARGFAFNADLVGLLRFLDMGTRIATALR
jgi:hypothetical protein